MQPSLPASTAGSKGPGWQFGPRMARFNTCLVRLIAVGSASFHVYTAYFGTFYPYVQRSVPLMLAQILTFLTIRGAKRKDTS